MTGAFSIVPGRGLAKTVSVQDRFQITQLAVTTSDQNVEGIPVSLAGQSMGDSYLESLDYVDHGMAIYKGNRAKDQCTATIKIFSLTGRLGDEHKVLSERFESAPKLKHPNLELIYEVGRKGDLFFVASERLEGENLGEKVERDGALPPDLAVKLLKETVEALSALHNRNHKHGDVSPETLFLCRNGTLKVTGVNQTKPVVDPLTLGSETLGNLDYLAPERIDGRAQDAASDLYSLGHSFYYLLAGRAPFAGNSPIATMICHLNQEPPDLKRISDGISEDCVKIFNKLTGKTIDVRYQDSQQVLTDLKFIEEGRGNRISLFKKRAKEEQILKVVRTSLVGVMILFVLVLAGHIASTVVLTLNQLENPARGMTLPLLKSEESKERKTN
jgi:serine/threonine protein kinase